MDSTELESRASAGMRSRFGQAMEPYILFPVFSVLLIVVIWAMTVHLAKVERIGAENAAIASTRELVETYEAQAVRVMHEIDKTLKFVKYTYDLKGEQFALEDLKAKALLPPDLLFVVSIANREGVIAASTRPFGSANVASQEYFKRSRQSDELAIGRPQKSPGSSEWKLQFSRRLNAADGSFAGIVIVTVDAAFFVSGYEKSKLGEDGMLGILGTDGLFRARRMGDTVSADDRLDDMSILTVSKPQDEPADVSIRSSGGIARYTSVRRLYEFPLIVMVGVARDEYLANTLKNSRVYTWWAAAGTVLLVLFGAVSSRMSWQIVQSRRRVAEAQIAYAERVEYLAYHDSLTTLPNRSLFSKLLNQGISQAHRYDRRMAVMFLDLDGFKHINDTLGHEAGDRLLQEIANRLKACMRDADVVARLGGDEFVVLLTELSQDKYLTTVAHKILSAVAQPVILQGQEFHVTASIGISVYPQDGQDEQKLTKNADIAMYQAKVSGKNNFQFFSEKLTESSLERLTLESSVRVALERGEFQLYYQAKTDVHSGRITGMEALLRWQHPELGTVAPAQFIHVAEETDLIVLIGRWVLKTACEQSIVWRRQGLPYLSMAVNLTARQFFDDHLLSDVTSILQVTGMEPQLLELEVSESVLLRDIEKTSCILSALKDIGVRIAIDDFGVGYSSFTLLKRFPLDTIKIDRSFIHDILGTGEGRSLADAIIAMGRSLSMAVVAQGVETGEQVEFLRKRAYGELQGFYCNKPVPAEQFEILLQAERAADV